MDKLRAQALQVTKEIMVKFIEIGRISPTNFHEYFGRIYDEVLTTITKDAPRATRGAEDGGE